MLRSLFFLSVCATTAAAQQITDSAGARIIRYPGSAQAKAHWMVDPKPLVTIGGSNGQGPSELAGVLGVVRLSNGNIVIADGGSTELRIFGPDGKFIRTVGRKGTGPGEFDGILLTFRTGDTVAVHDRQTRLQVYTGDGTFLRQYARPTMPQRSVNSWQGLLADGSGVVQAIDPLADSVSEHTTSTATLGVRAPDNNEARGFTHIPVFERVKKNGTSVGLFLGAVSRTAVMGERLCSGYSLRWEVQCFDRNGKLISRTVRAVDPGPVTAADIAEFKKGYSDANKTMPPDRLQTQLSMLFFAEQRSAFGRFVPSATGELWIGEFFALESFIPGRRGTVVPSRPTTWSVLASDGTWSADVTLPAKFSLLDAGRDYVAGITLDENDVESVVVYRLRRS